MGELIEFPASRRDAERPGADDEPRSGAGSAPSARPAQQERWAVPVLDAGESAAEPGPTPSRADDRGSRRASNVAMAALARHDASEGEVRARLLTKGLEDDEVEAEMSRLRNAGLVDDVAFAERMVTALRERKGLGDSAVRTALRGRLVPPSVVDAVLSERVEDEESLQERLQAVADDRARRLTSLTYAVAERRLTAYLLRKGYGGSAVRAAVRAALDGVGVR